MNHMLTCSLLAAAAGVAVPSVASAQAKPAGDLAHTSERFNLVIAQPYSEIFPLFGAHEERKWAIGFDPEFLYPVPPHDQPGMVFTTVQDGLRRVWTNTAFDASTGHVQYVYWIANTMAARIDIHIENSGARDTRVHVVYERTSLRAEANELVLQMAQADATCGPRWTEMIDEYFRSVTAK
ncbi:MAG TPA: hypothetical protein VMU45_12920 [Candidatus Eisenbacteria bacterium]|nr:hypothetical protein [Candidatus Eisenbacteria bacterium]